MKATRLWCLMVVVLLVQTEMNEGAKILGLFPFHGKSHSIITLALMEELASRGHEVTVVSFHPRAKPLKNYKDMTIKTYMDFTEGRANVSIFDSVNEGFVARIHKVWGLTVTTCEEALKEPNVQELIHSRDLHFDLVIMEAFFNECFSAFAPLFNAPLVQITANSGPTWTFDWFANPNPYAYIPDIFLNFSHKMNFLQRTLNTLMGMFLKLGRQYYYLPKQDAVMRKYFGDIADLPSIAEIERTTSLLLVNSHFSLNFPRPLMPNIIQVAGLHVKAPKKLPEDLQKYLDEAKDGAIYFSMGSFLKSSELPKKSRDAFLQAFSKLKQRVLWKWEDESLPGQPSNLKLGKWLPQADILAHPNVRVFITHGGLLGSQEAIHRGVPVLGIPVFADQFQNMARAVSAGYGLMLNFNNITEESVSGALNQMISNPSYRENAQRLSRIYRDQPLTPLEQAVFWTEYVIRHKGAPHMRSAALDLAWYQYFLLDVIAALAFIVVSFLTILFVIVRMIVRKFCASKKSKKTATTSQKKRQ